MSNDCSHPPLSTEQTEIVTGLLMGDAWLNRTGKNSYLQLEMITPEYMRWLDSVFRNLSKGVHLRRTAEEVRDNVKENKPYWGNGEIKNYNDIYRWQSVKHPELNKFNSWYKNGKSWPKEINITPTILKHWYIGDGTFDKRNERMTIRAENESHNIEKVLGYFSNIPDPRFTSGQLYWTKEDSKEVWEYMGKPLPGFEYKWPKNLR
jgi:hypothetical protein